MSGRDGRTPAPGMMDGYKDLTMGYLTGADVRDALLISYADAVDGAILANNWQTASGASWGDGDFNGDGRVDDIDAAIMAANWG